MDQGAFAPGRSKKDKWFFVLSTVFFALHILPSIIAAGLSIMLLKEPTSTTTPLSFEFFRWGAMAYLISCPGVLLWGCTVPWLFHKQGSEIRIKHHLFFVLLFCAPLLLTLNVFALRFFF